MFQPETNVRLLNTPLEPGYSDTLWFPDVNTQTEYFLSKTVSELTEFQYVKKDYDVLCVAGTPEQYYNINYVMYQNSNYSGKWFYAFISGVRWASMGATELIIQTDCIQTWFFDITYYQSFILRQHSVQDWPGANLVPEPVSGGNIVSMQEYTLNIAPNRFFLLATCGPDGTPVPGGIVNNTTFSGAAAIGLDLDASTINTVLDGYVENGTANGVIGMHAINVSHPSSYSIAKYPETIVGYTPKNNKLRTGVFLTFYVQAMGQEIEINPIACSGTTINLAMGHDEIAGTFIVMIDNYGGYDKINDSTPISLTIKYPESAWAYNQYQNDYNLHSGSNAIFMKRSRANRIVEGIQDELSLLRGAGGLVDSGLSFLNPFDEGGEISSAVSSLQTMVSATQGLAYKFGGIDETTQALARITESLQAPAVGNLPNSNAYTTLNKCILHAGFKSPPQDIVKRIDDYLTMYGYAQNDFAVPNLHARKYFTYIQVSDLRASGNFPGADMNQIRQAFNAGIHFWDYQATFGDFSQDNRVQVN